jgi:hypothetical protein
MMPFAIIADVKSLPLLLGLTVWFSRLDAAALYFPRSFLQKLHFPFHPLFVTEVIEKMQELYGIEAPVRATPRPGRNDPCPCGSSAKYKKCCALIDPAQDA